MPEDMPAVRFHFHDDFGAHNRSGGWFRVGTVSRRGGIAVSGVVG